MTRNRWTREETIVAYALYCVIPFSKINNSNKVIPLIASKMNHSAASLKMKMCNYASLDPDFLASGRSGLWGGVSKLDREVFAEFQHDWGGLSSLAEQIVGEDIFAIDEPVYNGPKGKAHFEIAHKQKRKFFRRSVLASYEEKCCISGITTPDFLVASHIKPWKDCDPKTERANPSNGLCLNSFYDQAFDKGYITVRPDLRIQVSKKVREFYTNEFFQKWLLAYDGMTIQKPARFYPAKLFLEYHNDVEFERFAK